MPISGTSSLFFRKNLAIWLLRCQIASDISILRFRCAAQHWGREAPVRFGSVTVWGRNGSCSSGFRFQGFLCEKDFSVFQCSSQERTVPVPVSVPEKRFWRFRFRFLVSGKTVLTVLVSVSGSVPGPSCKLEFGHALGLFLQTPGPRLDLSRRFLQQIW